MIARRHLLGIGLLSPMLAQPALTRAAVAQTAPAQTPLTPEQRRIAEEERLRTDWPYLGRYRDDNRALLASGVRPEVVFMGDSITQGWPAQDRAFFRPGRVGRGISAQTTPQMLVRFRPDVIDLKPRVVHIMAGTNDVAGNTGPMTPEMTQANLMSMTDLAQANGIRVILASIPPALAFPWRPTVHPGAPIAALNVWVRQYAAARGLVYADYWPVLADASGGMRPGMANDGVHPTPAGYRAMAPVAEAAIARALARPVRRVAR